MQCPTPLRQSSSRGGRASTEAFNTFHRLKLLNQDGRITDLERQMNVDTFCGTLAHFMSYGSFGDPGPLQANLMNLAEFLLRCASSPADFWDSSGGEIPTKHRRLLDWHCHSKKPPPVKNSWKSSINERNKRPRSNRR